MAKLNCQLGDLAITVNCCNPENLGLVVRIIGSHGMVPCTFLDDEPAFLWEVEVANPDAWIVYETYGYATIEKSGPAPDMFLRRIAPPENLLTDETDLIEQLSLELDNV